MLKNNRRKTLSIIMLTIMMIAMLSLSLVSYAYYSSRTYIYTENGKEILKVGMKLDQLFDKINSDPTLTQISTGDSLNIKCNDDTITKNVTGEGDNKYYTYDPTANWGTANNPFLISTLRHLQNLTVLQNVGYFDSNFTGTFEGDGDGESCMPYFLVCKPDGSSVVIDGSSMDENTYYEPIGNDAYPFVGYLGGSIKGDTVTVNGKTANQSVFYNIKIKPKTDFTDVGLFGVVGYLGDESTKSKGTDGVYQFYGASANVRDILLYDIQITVAEPTVWDAIVSLTQHMFNFKQDSNDGTPHENHHIGILAGHVEYASLQYISVYYSSDDICAIDITHTGTDANGVYANYYSASGILGYVHNMNCTSENGIIHLDGVENADISVSSGGVGSGGGSLSGLGRGYVTAEWVSNNYYTDYNNGEGTRDNVTEEDRVGQEVWWYYEKGNTTKKYGVMVDYNGTNYVLHDYAVPATKSGNNFIINGNTWSDYIVCDKTKTKYTYKSSNNLDLTSFGMQDMVIRNGLSLEEDELLCTEYVRSRIIYGDQHTDMYYFYDGVFTFALSNNDTDSNQDVIEDTWKNNTPDTITLGQDDSSLWTNNENGETNAIMAFGKLVTSEQELRESGKKIFIAYKDSDGDYHLVTLAENSAYQQGNMNDAITTSQTELSILSDAEKADVKTALDLGALTLDGADATSGALVDEEELKANWNDVYVFNVGAVTGETFSLDTLRQRYQISVGYTDKTADSNTYLEDGSHADSSILQGAYTQKNKLYMADNTNITDVTSTNPSYFKLADNSTQVSDISGLSSAISTQNGYLYEDDWATEITQGSSVLKGHVTLGDNITQTENVKYDEYFFFWTERVTSLKFICRYYYVDSSGNRTEVGTIECSRTRDDRFKNELYAFFSGSKTATTNDGIKLYYKSGYAGNRYLPLFYELSGSFYFNYERNTSNTQFVSGLGNAVVFEGSNKNKPLSPFTASYNYFIAKKIGAEVLYYQKDGTTKLGGTPTVVSGKYTSNMYTSTATSLYGKNYQIYSYGGTEGILLTKIQLDGYLLKSMTATGIKYTMGVDTVNGTLSVVKKPGTNTDLTLTLNGVSYKIYIKGSKVGPLLVNYSLDGYMLELSTNNGTRYQLVNADGNSDYTQYGEPTAIFDSNGSPLTVNLPYNGSTKKCNLYVMASGTAYAKLVVRMSRDEQTGDYVYQFSHINLNKDNNPSTDDEVCYLGLLKRTYVISYYSVLCGTNYYANTASNFAGGSVPTVSNSKDATLSYNSADGTWYISYTISGTTRYLRYDTTNNHFDTATNNRDSAAKLYIFTVEGTHDATEGNVVTPLGTSTEGTYSADSYVLYPKTTLTTTENGAGESVSSTTSTDPVYQLKSLNELAGLGFKNQSGYVLSKNDLYKRFSMAHEISWGLTLSAFNGEWNFGSDGLNNKTTIVAPIGSNGTEANIPKGCIAFRMNKDNADGNRINVIVSIPVSAYNTTESGYDLETDEDYYFGMWQVQAKDNWQLSTFQKSNANEKFELPRSHPYEVGVDPDTSDYILVEYNGKTCRAYLNGGQILVAYSFVVYDEGVYVLGATNGPMEIVYFSADATASSADDGSTNYRMGTIDYVYCNSSNQILTVKDYDEQYASTNVKNVQAYYYPSYTLIYTNNISSVVEGDSDTHGGVIDSRPYYFPNINDFSIYVCRTIVGDTVKSYWRSKGSRDIGGTIVDAAYIQMVGYSYNSDEVVALEQQTKENT